MSCVIPEAVGIGCNEAVPQCDSGEIDGNGLDDDCDGAIDEYDQCSIEDVSAGDFASAVCDLCGRQEGMPVDLLTREAFVGPHEDVRIHDGVDSGLDLFVDRVWDSRDNELDSGTNEDAWDLFGAGWRSNINERLLLNASTATPQATLVLKDDIRRIQDDGSDALGQYVLGADRLNGSTHERDVLSGDARRVYSYKDGVSTIIYPQTTTGSVTRIHARLKAVFPGNRPNVHLRFLYEDDVLAVSGPECSSLVDNTSCNASRGLLVKIQRVFCEQPGGCNSSSERIGQSLVMHYTTISGRIRLESILSEGSSLVRYAYYASTAAELIATNDGAALGCTTVGQGCQRRRYGWTTGVPKRLTTSSLSAVANSSGGVDISSIATVAEETFTWPSGLLSTHASPGTVLSSPSFFPVPGTTETDVTWSRNGASETSRYSATGAPLACESGLCGEDTGVTDDGYHTEGGRAVARTREKQLDGQWRLRLFDGPLVTTEVLASSTSAPNLTETPVAGGVELAVTNGVLNEARRYYYSSVAPFRLIATAEWRTRNGSTPVRFPDTALAIANRWVSESLTRSVRVANPPNPLVAVGGTDIQYELTIVDADSDGLNAHFSGSAEAEARLNEPGQDYLPAIIWHVGAPTIDAPGGPQQGVLGVYHRTDLTRDTLGRVTRIEEYYQGLKKTDALIQYGAVTLSDVRLRYRMNLVEFGLNAVLSGSTRRQIWRLCAPTAPLTQAMIVDPEGTVICEEEPNVPLTLRRLTTVSRDPSLYRLWVTASQEVTSSGVVTTRLTDFQRTTGSGFLFETGRGDGTPGQVNDGNKLRFLVDGTSTSLGAKGTLLAEVQERDGLTGALLRRTVMDYDSRGNRTRARAIDAAGVVALDTTWAGHDEDGLPASRTGLVGQTTSLLYTADHRIDSHTEPDGQVVNRSYDSRGFMRTLSRVSAGQLRFSFAPAAQGDLESISVFPTSQHAINFGYDGIGNLVREDTKRAFYQRDYSYDLPGRVSRVTVSEDLGAAGVSDLGQTNISRDGLGRTTLLHFTPASADIVSQWDTKTPTYLTSCVVGGRTLSLTDNQQRLRLGWASDEDGADFYEYDALGRVVAKLRHDGPLAAFACSKLRETRYTYAESGQVSQIRYPSGRMVSYGYGADRSRPLDVAASTGTDGVTGVTTIARGITYDGAGAMKRLTWETSGWLSQYRAITRDTQGRITEIRDGYLSDANWSKLIYIYDADGNLTTETDASTGWTMLRSSTAGGSPSSSFDYDSVRDALKSWYGHDSANSLTAWHLLTFEVDGRRKIEEIDYPPAGCSSTVGQPTTCTSLRMDYPTTLTAGAEELLSHTYTAGDVSGELQLGRRAAVNSAPQGSRVISIDRNPVSSSSDDMSLAYGPRGELDRVEDSNGAWESYYDADLRRVGRKPPTLAAGSVERWRYGSDRRVLAYETTGSTVSTTTEYIWLGSEVIGAIAWNSTFGATSVSQVHSDRMGVPRKVSTLTGGRVNRLIMDPWGRGVVVSDSSSTAPKPSLGMRYPGQWEDVNHRLINNGVRTLISETGQYTTPEPLLRQTYERGFTGPLAYSYSAGNPLRFSDSSGTEIDGGWESALAFGLVTPDQVAGYQTAAMQGGILGLGGLGAASSGGGVVGTAISPARQWLAAQLTFFGATFNRLAGSGCSERSQNSAQKLLPAARQFAAGQLDKHFTKHASEWGAGNITRMGYLKRAQDLLGRPVGGDILGATRTSGEVLRWNTRTNEFAAALKDGTIGTLFRPHDGPSNWARRLSDL